MNVSFGSLAAGDVFYADGKAYKKLNTGEGFDNAMTIGSMRNSARFEATDRVETGDRVPQPSWWRRWLLTRSLRWHFAGFPGWARWSWRLARLWSRGDTEMQLAAYATQLMMMGE